MRFAGRTVLGLALSLSVACLPPDWGANAILHPVRRPLIGLEPALAHEEIAFRTDDGLELKGWLFRAQGPRRGLIVYLHGIADNRRSGIGVAQRFVRRGWDVLAYDARAHGRSEGTDCTYGFREKQDVSRALDAVHADRVVLFGSSLGAAVALQAAAIEPRVRGVIAQSPFSDLETIVRERAPWFATPKEVGEALALVEKRTGFRVADVSPRAAAALIHVPVLLLHGARDRETSPAHSSRIYDALKGPRQILIVPGAGHNDVLAREDVWGVVERWLARLSASGGSCCWTARLAREPRAPRAYRVRREGLPRLHLMVLDRLCRGGVRCLSATIATGERSLRGSSGRSRVRRRGCWGGPKCGIPQGCGTK